MKKEFYYWFSLISFIFISCSSEFVNPYNEDNSLELYPLKVGNIWVYEVTHHVDSFMSGIPSDYKQPFIYFDKYIIVDSQKSGTIMYYKIQEQSFFPDTIVAGLGASNAPHKVRRQEKYQWQGLSSNTELFFSESNPSEAYTYFDFLMGLNDKHKFEDHHYSVYIAHTVEVVDVDTEYIFNKNREFKVFETKAGYHRTIKKYVQGIGLFSGEFSEESYYNRGKFKLKGCVIDNVVYGDTSTILY